MLCTIRTQQSSNEREKDEIPQMSKKALNLIRCKQNARVYNGSKSHTKVLGFTLYSTSVDISQCCFRARLFHDFMSASFGIGNGFIFTLSLALISYASQISSYYSYFVHHSIYFTFSPTRYFKELWHTPPERRRNYHSLTQQSQFI